MFIFISIYLTIMYLNTIIIDNEDIQISKKEETKIAVNFFNSLFEYERR